MPVYFFALSFVKEINWLHAIVSFILVHLFLYPASNGYNSYMDRDTESIGGIEKPMQPTTELFYATIVMDVAGTLLSFFISWKFVICFVVYIIFSRLYSYRGTRLKRFPVAGYLTVMINQGALVFFMVYIAANKNTDMAVPLNGMIAAAFLIGGFYPITQVYQHKADADDDVKTISMLLGKKGTFIFCAVMYMIAFAILFFYFRSAGNLLPFIITQVFFVPVIIYFFKWMMQVFKDEQAADFKRTMRMNMLAGTCTNMAFITLIIINQIG